jgi:hypothetical protein
VTTNYKHLKYKQISFRKDAKIRKSTSILFYDISGLAFIFWQAEIEGGTLIYFAFGPTPPTMPGNNPVNIGQPDSNPLEVAGFVQALENTKQLVPIFHVKPCPIVFNKENGM